MIIKVTSTFTRELKKLIKKHYPVQVLKPCVKAIETKNKSILIRIKNHALHGQWKGYQEFHPARYGSYGRLYDNWIVIYTIRHKQLILTLVATGGHELLSRY